ncbi:hypothetical protein [Arthrobacter sp. NPDC090010]|uniref:hypothetical protein n=1 Tax=Arthrobacter sp. NPDC090010 TaxID=3363942 RepID=UPI0038129F33
MEPLLIPLLILVVVVALVLVVARRLGRPSEPRVEQDPRELAREAAGRLTVEQHRALYSLIAREEFMGAIRIYREATGAGLRQSRDTVLALAKYPQPFQAPRVQDSTGDEDEDSPEVFTYRYRAIVNRGDTTLEVSSNMLNDAIYGRIQDLARSGDRETAARLLVRHSTITLEHAREFVDLI